MTKYYVLFQLLKSKGSSGASPDACAEALAFAANSVAPYIWGLRTKFGAEIETVRSGRQVAAYVLKNVSEVESNISPKRRPKGTASNIVAKQVVSSPAVAVKNKNGPVEVEDLYFEDFSDAELNDIKSQLGLA